MNRVKDIFGHQMFMHQLRPAVISAISLILGDMADAIVIGTRMGEIGLAAISITLPIFMLFNVIMHGLGLGGAITYSERMARGEEKKANAGYQGTLLVTIIIGFAILLCVNIFMSPILTVLGADPESTLLFNTCATYLRITGFGAPFILISYVLGYYLRNSDMEKEASIGFVTGNICDISLNIILVLFLDMGVAGAGISTVSGQVIAVIIYIFFIIRKKSNLRIYKNTIDISNVSKEFVSGFSSSIQYLFNLLFIIIANNLLMRFENGVEGVAVFNLIENISYIFIYWYTAVSNASQPIYTTYTGECNLHGKKELSNYSITKGLIIGSIIAAVIFIWPEIFSRIFGLQDPSTISLASYAIRVYCIASVCIGYNLMLNYYESCSREKIAYISASLRGAVILIPVTILFGSISLKAFWLLYPVTEIISMLIVMICRKRMPQEKMEVDESRVCRYLIQNSAEGLTKCVEELQVFCEKMDASPKQSYFVQMSLEELGSAILTNGFKNGTGLLQITLVAGNDGIFTLHIRDNAITFNPFSLDSKSSNWMEASEKDMEAMGVMVIRERARDFFYRRYQGFNTLIVKI